MNRPAGRWKYGLTLVLITMVIGVTIIYHKNVAVVDRTAIMLASILDSRLITHAETGGEKLVALTFDDGPDRTYTPMVLDILRRYQVKATFFVVGENARESPSLVRQELAEGHEIENHTLTHPSLNRGAVMNVVAEIMETQLIIEDITGRYPVFFRPPKRLYNSGVIKAAQASGMKVVLWTVCVENSSCKTPAEMAKRVIGKARPGTIILAHDGRLNRSATVQALPQIIEGYREKGYTFVTLEELLSRTPPAGH